MRRPWWWLLAAAIATGAAAQGFPSRPVPNVLVVHPSLPANNVAELIDYLKKNPGKLNYASPGYGTSPQMSMELFKGMTGTFIVHIPFRGSGPAQAAMLAGETQLMFDNLPPQM